MNKTCAGSNKTKSQCWDGKWAQLYPLPGGWMELIPVHLTNLDSLVLFFKHEHLMSFYSHLDSKSTVPIPSLTAPPQCVSWDLEKRL